MWEKGIYMSVENNTSVGEVASMARAGVSLRGDNRGYLQSDFGVQNDLSIIQHADNLGAQVVGEQRRGVTRAMWRFLISEQLLPAIARDHRLRESVETVFPTSLRSPNGDRVMIYMGARNHPSRVSSTPREEMIRQVEEDQRYRQARPVTNLAERISKLRQEGYQFISQIPEHLYDAVHQLWGPTFGWERAGVISRARQLHHEADPSSIHRSSEKSVWFSGLINPKGDLVAVATAERGDMRVGNGLPPVSLIELSEWSSKEEGKGHMAAVNTHLIAQGVQDLQRLDPQPTFLAEANHESRAHRAGLASGMEIAPRLMQGIRVPQLLQQHVTVGDGHMPVGLRSFSPMFVSDETITNQFHDAALEEMLGFRPTRSRNRGGI